MSQSIVCLAMRDTLRTGLSLGTDPNVCDIALGGKPFAMAGQVFYAVHPYGWRGQSQDYDLDEEFGGKVTVTRRLGDTPNDRTLAAAWSNTTDGLDKLCRAVLVKLHRQQSVRLAANAMLSAMQEGLITELWFMGADPEPVQRYSDWFYAEVPEGAANVIMGISITMTFGRSQRVQTIAGMT